MILFSHQSLPCASVQGVKKTACIEMPGTQKKNVDVKLYQDHQFP
jgi:hypothetical protein